MSRATVTALFFLVGLGLGGCSGDDTVDPTNPDASSATKVLDGGGDGSKHSPVDASGEGGDGGVKEKSDT